MLYLLDLDNTLADHTHRGHLIEEPNPDWQAFLHPDRVRLDSVIPSAVPHINELWNRGTNDCWFLTGRNEGLIEVTLDWIREHFDINVDNVHLIMRPVKNDMKPTEWKDHAMSHFLGFNPTKYCTKGIAFDDDLYMTQTYMKYGFLHLHAPNCWDILKTAGTDLPAESYWRK